MAIMLLVVLVAFTGKSSQQVVTTNIDDIVGQIATGNIDEIFLINEGIVSSSPTNTCDGTFLGGFLFGRLLAPMAMADGSTMTTGQVMVMTLMSILTGVPQTAVPMVCPPQLTTTPCPSTPPQRTINRVILCGGDVPAFISCDSQINIVEAVYGRLDPNICPDPRILTTSCRSPTSDALVKTDCNGQTICQLVANNGKFGEPCQETGTSKADALQCGAQPFFVWKRINPAKLMIDKIARSIICLRETITEEEDHSSKETEQSDIQTADSDWDPVEQGNEPEQLAIQTADSDWDPVEQGNEPEQLDIQTADSDWDPVEQRNEPEQSDIQTGTLSNNEMNQNSRTFRLLIQTGTLSNNEMNQNSRTFR
ncbi:Hypothetical predicted protein [Mytilus galloprovincialis]|uniref:SUEL-type lectin domain-containing protein n=1 Tax=Mytilus galloprovincialis TaxID=29158 RepID=A0A8B6H1K3_MYTGA|nr:Hypothetical predicted protein [Mytilus galloprovincialis]